MFNDLGYFTRIEHGMLKIWYDTLIITKGSTMCSLYILDGSIVTSNTPLASKLFHDKTKV